MNSTIQIVAFYIMSAVLLGFAVHYTSKKHFRLSGLFVLLSFVSFVLAQFSGEGLPVGFHSISIEQCLCWGFVLIKRITDQKRELDAVQAKIREAETNIIGQQSDITNQYQTISLMQSGLKIAETNLDAQEKKLSDVEYWVQNLFDEQREEQFSITMTNSLQLLLRTNRFYCIVRLGEVPINNSIEFSIYDNNSRFPRSGKARSLDRNIIISDGFVNFDTNSMTVTVKYVADSRTTNLLNSIPEPELNLMNAIVPQ